MESDCEEELRKRREKQTPGRESHAGVNILLIFCPGKNHRFIEWFGLGWKGP